MECREIEDRLSPYLDDELDPAASRAIAQHLASCASCTAALAQQQKLREALRTQLPYHRAPDLLRARLTRDVRAVAHRPEPARGRALARPWSWVGAAAALVVVAGGALLVVSGMRDRDAIVREAVADHVRSLLADHLADVVSTDQHTVKPWFGGKLDFSPPVADFAAAGYPLTGGRLDYLNGRTVAALVYMHRKHVINVFVWPAAGGDALAPAVTRQGFHVVRAVHADMAFCLVSDLNATELTTFARMLAGR